MIVGSSELESGPPVGDDVVVAEVHLADPREDRAHAVAGDDRHAREPPVELELAAGRQRLEPVAGQPAVEDDLVVWGWIRRNWKPEACAPRRAIASASGRAEGVVHDRDLARQAQLELGAREAGRHRVAGQVAARQHQVARADRLVLGSGPPPVAAPARAADEEDLDARPARGSRTSSTRSRAAAGPRPRPGRRSGCAGTRARRRPVELHLGAEAVGRFGRRTPRRVCPSPAATSWKRSPRPQVGLPPRVAIAARGPSYATLGSRPQRQPFCPSWRVAGCERSRGLSRRSGGRRSWRSQPRRGLPRRHPGPVSVTHEVSERCPTLVR